MRYAHAGETGNNPYDNDVPTGQTPVTSGDTNERAIRGDDVAGVEIRDVRLRDLRQVARIQQSSFRPGLAYGIFPLVTLHLMPFVTFVVARQKETGQILGCIIGDRYRGDVRIMNIAVHPEWRRQGIARELLHAIGERLPEGNIVLMAEENNYGAIALYESEGFTRTDHLRNYYGPRRHGIEMTLQRMPPAPTRNGKPTSGRIRV
jgi:ribosomal-protein-alanine N-acetyltransferase